MKVNRSIAAAVLTAAAMASGLGACATSGGTVPMSDRNSPNVRATAVSGKRDYDKTTDAILAADLDAVVAKARASGEGPSNAAVASIIVMDELAAGRPSSARAMLDTLPERYRGGAGDLLEPWVFLAEGNAAEAVNAARDGAPRLPGRLGNVLVALIQESSGDLAGAEQTYARMESTLDVAEPSQDEPNSLEEAIRQLAAPQTTQILYRYALVEHRLGKKADALRLYGLVAKFAPNSPDLTANMARANRGEAPLEPALDKTRGLGRWALFLSEEFGRTEGLAQALSGPAGPQEGLVSPSAALFSQIGVALDPSATDWTIGAAYTLMGAKGYAGAERLIRRVPANDVYAPDAAIALAELAVRQDNNAKAASEAERALRLAPDRWTIALSAASVLTRAGRDAPAIAAYDAALAKATAPKDRATVLIARAAAHHYYGRVESAVNDGRAAVAADRRADIRIAAVSYLLDYPDGWTEAVKLGRELLQERPESVARLNQLGYTLIHRPEGLEEGYRLLSRGVALGENDYAVIDSLGWAYYLYGDFEQALAFIERSNELSPEPNAEILDHLGDVYWRLGQQDKAKEVWAEALAAKPEARRRAALTTKVASGLTTPAPERRRPPTLEPFTPRQRSDT